MKTILVPTDYSVPAQRALQYAFELSRIIRARIVLFHAFHQPINIGQAPKALEKIQELEEAEKMRLETYLQEELQSEQASVAPALRKGLDEGRQIGETGTLDLLEDGPEGGLKVECLAKFGLAEDEIVRLAQDLKADLLVMGMRGANPISGFLLGSTTTKVMYNTPCPLLAIPKQAAFQPIGKILYATDFKGLPEETICQSLVQLKQLFGAKLCLLHVYNKDDNRDLNKSIVADDLEYYLRDQDYTLFFVEKDDVVEGILEYQEKINPQLLALVPRRKKFLDRLLGKRVSKNLAFRTTIPLLALPYDNR